MKKFACRLAAGLGLLLTAAAAETQTLSFLKAPKNLRAGFLLDQEAAIQESFTVRHKGTGTPYFITFSAGQGGSFLPRLLQDGAGNTLAYYIFGDTARRNVLKDLSAAPASTEVLSGDFPDSSKFQSGTHDFAAVIPAGVFPAAGTYKDAVIMNLYTGTISAPGEVKDQNSFSLTVTVAKFLDMALVAEGAPFDIQSTQATMNFGILSAGSRKSADLVVRSNTPYAVSVVSGNGSQMRINDPADPSAVPYVFAVNGAATALPAGVQTTVASGAAPTPFEGTRFRLSFTIGDFGMATEGAYQDMLTFTVTAN